jgi:non-canonical purine NTP pyrophosphatase (RdgB/HAM1 family)
MKKQKLVYLTTNPHKVEEANRFFRDKYGFDIHIVDPGFEVLEIQAKTSAEVVRFSVKYAADRLGMGCLKSDTSVYIDGLGGLPGPYNSYFDKQIGAEKFLHMLKDEKNRTAQLQHAFAYCEPNSEPVLFDGGSRGTIAMECRGSKGRWHDLFYIPDGETKTLSELREQDPHYEAKFWGTAIDDFATWYSRKIAA